MISSTTVQKNLRYRERQKDRYPYEYKSLGCKLDPEMVRANFKHHYLRIVLSKSVVWMFETQEALDAFKAEYGDS